MASWLNSLGNTRKTHIANGSDHTILAMVDMDRKRVTEASAKVEKAMSVSANFELYHTAAKDGYSKIVPGKYVAFHMGTGLNDTVYITIYQEGKSEPLWCAHPLRNNHSAVVGDDDMVHNTKMGKIWIDDEGNDWERK